MNDHYIVTLDRGRLRIYAETHMPGRSSAPRLDVVEAMDFPGGVKRFTDHDTDTAGRFPSSKADSPGTAIGERRPTSRQDGRRGGVRLFARELDTFLQGRPHASWDIAAAPALYRLVIEALSPATRRRLKRVLSKDLVHQRADEVCAHFATAGR